MKFRLSHFAAVATVVFASTAPLAAQDKKLTERDISIVRLGSEEDLTTTPTLPRGYAVVIGISDYANLGKDERLPYAEKDAENFYSALISKEGGQIEFENVKKLLGKDATRANIQDALENWLPSKAQPGDRVVVYFVGHGLTDEKRSGYLAPYDVDLADLEDTAYPMARLGSVLSNDVKAGFKLLFVDACHSGKINVTSTLENINESLRGLPQGFLTLTSSRASEPSYEDPDLAGGSGVFTYYLVRGWLGEADVDPADGRVTADELIYYVKREVREHVRSKGNRQTPLEFGDFPYDLILGYNPSRQGELAEFLPEAANGTVVVEANLEGTEIYIDDLRYGVAAPDQPLRVPGLATGTHRVRGVRAGYEPATVEVNVIPGGTQTVSIRLFQQRVVDPEAAKLYDRGERLWRESNGSDKDLAQAADLLQRALKLDDRYSRAALELCRVEQARGNTQKGLAACKTALEIDPDLVDARTMYGVLLMDSGDYGEAVRELQLASQQDAKNTYVYSLLAEAFFWADRPQEAEAAADRAVTLDDGSAQAYLLRAEARRVQSKFEESIPDYHRTLDLASYDSGIARKVAFWVIGMGMRKNRSGRRALYRSQTAAAYYGLCADEIGLENFREAVKYCDDALDVDEKDPQTHLLTADAWAGLFSQDNRRRYLLETEQSIQTSLRLNPNQENAALLERKLHEIDDLLSVFR